MSNDPHTRWLSTEGSTAPYYTHRRTAAGLACPIASGNTGFHSANTLSRVYSDLKGTRESDPLKAEGWSAVGQASE